MDAFAAIRFYTVLIPFMIFNFVTMCGSVLEFIASLYSEFDCDETSLLTPTQISNLVTVLQNLLAYFAIFTLSDQLDNLIDLKKATHSNFKTILLSGIAVQSSLLIQIIKNYHIRKQIS